MAYATRRTQFFRRFAHARRGAVAVEFAFVAVPFLLLLFGTLELALVMMVSMTLETATEDAARVIRTGEFQTSGSTGKIDFQKLVCDGMTWLKPGCSGKLSVDVETFAINDFQAMANSATRDTQTFDPTKTCFSPGGPADVVMVRTYYEWTLFTPLLNDALVNAGNNKRLINSVVSFRNEPFNNNAPVGAKCT